MKKLLALLLSLLLCLSFVVSCGVYEDESSSSSDESCCISYTSTESSSEELSSSSSDESCCISYTSTESSSEELSSSEKEDTQQIYPTPSDAYKTYMAKQAYGALNTVGKLTVLVDYNSYKELMQKEIFLEEISEITAETFESNFIIVLYNNRIGKIDMDQNPFYRNLRKENDLYVINYEYTYTNAPTYSGSNYEFYFIVIPKVHCENPLEITNNNFRTNKVVHEIND